MATPAIRERWERNSPRGWTRSSASPSDWRRPMTARTCSAPSSMRPCAPSTSTTSPSASCATGSSWSRPGRASTRRRPRPSRRTGSTRAGCARSSTAGRSSPGPTCRDRPGLRPEPLPRPRFAGDLVAPLVHHDRVIGALSAVTRGAARLDATPTRRSLQPGHPRRHRPDQRRAVRADRGPGRPAGRPPGRLRPAQPGLVGRGRRAHRRRGGPPGHRLPQRPGVPHRAARPGRADRLRGPRRRLRAGRLRPPALPPRRGLQRLGGASTASRSWPTTRTPTRAARPSSGPTTSTSR